MEFTQLRSIRDELKLNMTSPADIAIVSRRHLEPVSSTGPGSGGVYGNLIAYWLHHSQWLQTWLCG